MDRLNNHVGKNIAELASARTRAVLTANGESSDRIEAVLQRHQMLGHRCTYWVQHCAGTLPTNYQSRLIDRQNAATHSGYSLPKGDVRDAIAVAVEIVGQAIPLPS